MASLVETPQALFPCCHFCEQKLFCFLPGGDIRIPVEVVYSRAETPALLCPHFVRSFGTAELNGRGEATAVGAEELGNTLDACGDAGLVRAADDKHVNAAAERLVQRAQNIASRPRIGGVHTCQVAAVECKDRFVVDDVAEEDQVAVEPRLGESPGIGLHDVCGGQDLGRRSGCFPGRCSEGCRVLVKADAENDRGRRTVCRRDSECCGRQAAKRDSKHDVTPHVTVHRLH